MRAPLAALLLSLAVPAPAEVTSWPSSVAEFQDLWNRFLVAPEGRAVRGAPVRQQCEERGFSEALWNRLSPAAMNPWIRASGAAQGWVRELPFDAADAVFGRIACLNQTSFELFTESALTGPQVYYIGPEAIRRLYARYEVPGLTPGSGTTLTGEAFRLQAIVIGNGQVDMFYDRAARFQPSYYPDLEWLQFVDGHVRMRLVAGRGGARRVTVEGLRARGGGITATPRWVEKAGAHTVRIGAQALVTVVKTVPLQPVRRN